MKYLLYVPFCFLLCLCINTFSQNSQWMRYNNGDYIADIEEEGDLVWIGTWGGLVKYDRNSGEKTFYNKLNSGLPNNQIACIGIDSKGNKWIGYDKWWWRGKTGLVKFDGKNWEEYNTSNSELPHMEVNCILVDELDNIWIGTTNGLAKFDGITWEIFDSPFDGLPSSDINCLAVDGQNNILIGTSDGLAIYDATNSEISRPLSSEIRGEITGLTVDDGDNIWMLIEDSKDLIKFDGTNLERFTCPLSDSYNSSTNCIVVDDNNNKWVGTLNGLAKFDDTNWIIYDYNNPNFKGSWISSLMITDDGLLWVGDCSYRGWGNRSGNGLYTFDGTNWNRVNTSNCGLIDNSIGIIKIDNYDNKWIVPEWKSNAIMKFDGADWKVYDSTNSVLDSKRFGIRCIEIDMLNNLWIGYNSNLIMYDGTNWTVYDTTNSVIGKSGVGEIAVDSSNNIWLFDYDVGLIKYDLIEWTVQASPLEYINQIAVDIDGTIWIGKYEKGTIAKFDGASWNLISYPGQYVDFLEIDEHGNKWIGCFTTGIWKFDGTNWTNYNKSNSGLPDNYVNCIAFDESDNKWIGTLEGGLAKFDNTDWSIYNTSNSLLSSDFISCIDIDKYGNKWFGGYYSGLTVFNEDGIVSVKDNTETKIFLSSEYLLKQNYPNPFNPVTTIKYSIPTDLRYEYQDVRLIVYDVLGSEVATLVNEEQSHGNYEIEFNGSEYTSGIYFYRLQTSDYVETKKMIFLK